MLHHRYRQNACALLGAIGEATEKSLFAFRCREKEKNFARRMSLDKNARFSSRILKKMFEISQVYLQVRLKKK